LRLLAKNGIIKEKKEGCIMSIKYALTSILGVLGGFIASVYGGWSAGLTTLFYFIAIDFVMGILTGLLNKSSKTATGGLNSNECFRGILKKFTILILVFVAYRLDVMLQTTIIKDGTIIAFCVNELMSILENAGLIGLPIPKILYKAMDILNTKVDGLLK
jgi:toxin secretion/phage lysis holin